jgi:SAM-dependent methyltransferase
VSDDQRASQALRINRDRTGLLGIARQRGWKFKSALSLGCGGGRAERLLIKSGICGQIIGIDVSEGALTEARAAAETEGLAITYQQGDLNSIDLPQGNFDLVVTQTCLHHVLELERLAGQIAVSLVPGGCLWVDDFIGESQFQWLDRRISAANALLQALPERYRHSRLTGRAITEIVRRAPGTLISPFESIRSSEIVPIFTSHFDIEWKSETNTLLHLVAPVGTRANYAATQEGRDMFEVLYASDKVLLETGALPPLSGQFVLRNR